MKKLCDRTLRLQTILAVFFAHGFFSDGLRKSFLLIPPALLQAAFHLVLLAKELDIKAGL